jgi:hypothetical protein
MRQNKNIEVPFRFYRNGNALADRPQADATTFDEKSPISAPRDAAARFSRTFLTQGSRDSQNLKASSGRLLRPPAAQHFRCNIRSGAGWNDAPRNVASYDETKH